MIFRVLKIIVLYFVVLSLGCSHSRYRSAKVMSGVELDYPLSAQIDQREGEVKLVVFVNQNGKPDEINLEESSGHEDLDKAALEFAKSIEFEPALLDEKPIGSWTRIVLRYTLSEVYFEADKWVAKYRKLNRQLETETDSTKRYGLFKKLYTNNIGLLNYIDYHRDVQINSMIKSIVTKTIKNRYNDFWNQIPASFAILDDFIERYPDSPLYEQVKKELVRDLIDAEYLLRLKVLNSKRLSRKNSILFDQLKTRLNELQDNMMDISAQESLL